MSVNREELKRLIDQISDQDALEVYDFIGYLNKKRNNEVLDEKDVEPLARDQNLIRQIQRSREDRVRGNIYSKEQGLENLRKKLNDA